MTAINHHKKWIFTQIALGLKDEGPECWCVFVALFIDVKGRDAEIRLRFFFLRMKKKDGEKGRRGNLSLFSERMRKRQMEGRLRMKNWYISLYIISVIGWRY